MAYVVAVAGIAGAGKSTLVRELVAALGDAVAVHIDDYQRVTRRPVREIVQWMRRGGSFDEFSIPLLEEHLERLKRGERVLDPVTLRQILPRRYVIFETHFGRAHQATGRHIDLLVWIDTPLDVALARNLRDLVRPLLQDPGVDLTRDRVARLSDYVENYLADVRALVLMQQQEVAGAADVTVDGSGESAGIVEQVRRAILDRLS